MAGNLRIRNFSIGCLWALLVLTISSAASGVWLGYSMHVHHNQNCSQYALLNPLIRCKSDASGVFMPEYEEFENNLYEWIEKQRQAGLITGGAVYFRDLVGGPWFGVNEDVKFTPASLFKLPLLLAVLRVSQDMPELLSQQVIMSGAYTGLMNVEHPEETLKPGQPYTVDELLTKMTIYSDNASADMLKKLLGVLDESGQTLEVMYKELGMYSAATEHTMSVKNYASLFRILFNGRFLRPDLSQKALALLADSAYQDALKAGVPADVLVAHKFGIRDIPDEPEKQFHDCGIVYYPKRPYLLCVMTRSSDVQRAISFIREVSRRTYDQVDMRMAAEGEDSASE